MIGTVLDPTRSRCRMSWLAIGLGNLAFLGASLLPTPLRPTYVDPKVSTTYAALWALWMAEAAALFIATRTRDRQNRVMAVAVVGGWLMNAAAYVYFSGV